MNSKELVIAIEESCKKQLEERMYITACDCLLDYGFITEGNYELWENGEIEYLEKCATGNMSELSLCLNTIREFARSEGLKSTQLPYNGANGRLYFTKRKQENVECAYRTIYMDKSLKKRDIK